MKKYLLTFMIAVSFFAYSSPEKVVVKGELIVGNSDSIIESFDESGDDVSVSFLTKSEIGKKIFKACKMNEICIVSGDIDKGDEYRFLIKVYSVKAVK